jgi:hypothetical protein
VENKLRTAESLGEVAENVARFLGAQVPSNRQLFNDIITPLSSIGEVVIIGGLVRDLAFYGFEERPISDIDLVVRGSPSALKRFAGSIGAIPNKFGGYGLQTDAFKADFWALSSTWARQAGHVKMRSPSDLIRSTFFDWDAIIYSTKNSEVKAISGYLSRLHSRILDLNLEPNPSVKGNLVRALRRVMMWDARPGPKLRRFILGALRHHSWDELRLAEMNAFHTLYLSGFQSASEYCVDVLRNPAFHGVGRDDLRQATLFGELPSTYHLPEASHVTRLSSLRRIRRRNRSKTWDLFADQP